MKFYVVGALYNHAALFAKDMGVPRRDLVYISRADQLRGLRDITIYFLNSCNEVKDIDVIHRVCHTINADIVYED